MKTRISILLALLCGVLLAIGWPAIGGFEPALFLGLVPLLFLEEFYYKKQLKLPFIFPFLAFALFNILTTWWIFCVSESISTKILVLTAAVFVNSTMMSIVFSLFQYVKRKLSYNHGYFGLVIIWLGFEYFHHHWELTWPWLTLGNGFANQVSWIQWYESTGVMGGSLWILIVNVLIFQILNNTFTGMEFKKNLRWVLALTLVLLVPISISKIIYLSYVEKGNPIEVLIVQPNIDPYLEKYDLPHEDQLNKLLSLVKEKITSQTNFIIAPETALTEDIRENFPKSSITVNEIMEFLKQYPKTDFIAGMSSYYLYEQKEDLPNTARAIPNSDQYYDAFNAAIQLNKEGAIQIYHKSKLVQGVEKMPFAEILKPLEGLAIDLGGTTGSLGSQEESSVFMSNYKPIKIAPVICYESIYGEYVASYVNKGANLLFVITNDGWWDDTPGYKQHMAYSRLRAIETRRSIARAANTGISCFINQRGDVLKATNWWEAVAIRGVLNANEKITIFTKAGNYIGRLASFLAFALIIYSFVRSKKDASFVRI